jgi:hypothetical protein
MSQLTADTKRIGESDYLMRQLPPMQSHDLLMDVSKMLGPSLGPLLDTLFVGKDAAAVMDMDIGPAFFTQAAVAFFKGIDKKVISNTISAFAKVSEVDGKPLHLILDDHFHGNLHEMYGWLAWGMSVQWGKSVRALVKGIASWGAEAIAKMAAMQAGTLNSPPISTGLSGG